MRLPSLVILVLVGNNLFAQHSILQKFIAAQVQSRIYLEWTIKGGNTCNGIRVYRSNSLDSSFIEIGDIAGICGSSSRAESYSFVDSFPFANTTNYYYLQLGLQGATDTISFRSIGSPTTPYALQYDANLRPILQVQTQLINQLAMVYTFNGKMLVMQQIQEPKINLAEMLNGEAGVYILVIRNKNEQYVSKFFVH